MGIINRLSEALAERLRNLQGTEQVVNFGGVDEEIRLLVDRGELAALGLTIVDVATRPAAADVKNPAGTQRGGQQQLRITVAGELDATSRVAAVPMVNGTHEVISVGEIARVGKTWRQPPQEMAYADGRRAVVLGVRTRTAVHLDDWAASADALVEQARAELGEGYRLDVAFDQSR